MTPKLLLSELVRIAQALGLCVRWERFASTLGEGSGGRCRIRKQEVVLLNTLAPVAEQTRTLAEALSSRDTSGLEMTLATRHALQQATQRVKWRRQRNALAGATPRVLRFPKPGLRSTRPH